MHTYVVALRRCITDNKNTYYGQMFSHAFENVWSKAIVATNRMLHSLFFSLVSTFLPFFFLRDYLTLGSTLVKEPKFFSINKEHRVKCSIFFLLDFDISIIRQLTSYKIHRGSATVIWQGAGWHELIFSALRAVIMQTLLGAREALTAPHSKRQSQPFMSSSAVQRLMKLYDPPS